MKKKRILIIGLTEELGGVETFIYNTTRFSDSRKYVYEYLVHGTDHAIFQDEINSFYGENRFHFIDSIKRRPLKTFIELTKFYRQYGRKYDFIHFQTGAPSEVVYIFPFNFLFNIKVISHSHSGSSFSPFINNIFRPLLNIITQKHLSCSDEATKWLFGEKYLSKAIKVNNGIDTSKFEFDTDLRKKIRKQYGISDEDLVIGHIGRFAKEKNHSKIIEIFSKVIEKKPNSKLILVGAGDEFQKIKAITDSLTYSKSIIFAGSQRNTEAYYSAFDIFLMPSLYEGLPLVGIEAQSEGLACFFSTNIDKNILISNRSQMISLDESSEIWAEKILSIPPENDRKKYSQIVEQAGYSIKSTISVLEEIYEV